MTDQAELEARFARFVREHRAKALSTAWRLVGGRADLAEDMVQDAFLQAWKALPKFREESALSTWFYRILVRRASAHHRWAGVRRKWNAVLGLAPEAVEKPTPDVALQKRIAAALETLSAGQREAFVLVHLEGFPIAEAAQVLGKAEGTVKSHLHRATSKLREALANEWEGS